MVSGLQVVVTEAKGLRESVGRRQPDVVAHLRIIEKNSPKKPNTVSTVLAPRCTGTLNPEFNEAFTLSFADDEHVVYQLEVTLWDVGGQDKSQSNPQNFLGEVLLNVGKLKPWDGIILEQVFELRQGQYATAPRAQGQLFLKLKYQSESAPARPIGLSLVLYENWDNAVGSLQGFEHQLRQDIIRCLRTDENRVEMVGSEPRKTHVTVGGASFYPTITHVNLHLAVGGGRDMRPVQELEAQLLSMLKDTNSELYRLPVSNFTREILVHEPYRSIAPGMPNGPTLEQDLRSRAPPPGMPPPPPGPPHGAGQVHSPPNGKGAPAPPPPPKGDPPPPPPFPPPGVHVPFSADQLLVDVQKQADIADKSLREMRTLCSSSHHI